jgi:acyl transferase domain-containing protein
LDELLKPQEESNISKAEYAQPTSTAVQIALVNLLSGWGIRPAAVIGHSSGEIAAAYAAKALTAKEAIITAYYRGKAASRMPKGGSMTAVALSKEAVLPFLEPDVVVACENSPNSVVISGNEASLLTSCERIKKAEVNTLTRPLEVGVAYHSREFTNITFSEIC